MSKHSWITGSKQLSGYRINVKKTKNIKKLYKKFFKSDNFEREYLIEKYAYSYKLEKPKLLFEKLL
jgi:hypothetical protein